MPQEITPEKMAHTRAYQRAYYNAHKEEIKQKAHEYYMKTSEGGVRRRNRKFEYNPADEIPFRREEIGGALPPVENPNDVVFEQLPKRGPGRPPKDPNAPRKPKPDPNAPKKPVGRPRKEKPEQEKKAVGRPKKTEE